MKSLAMVLSGNLAKNSRQLRLLTLEAIILFFNPLTYNKVEDMPEEI